MKNPNAMAAFLMMVKLLGGIYFVSYGAWMLFTHKFSVAFPVMIVLGLTFWYFAWIDPDRDALLRQLMGKKTPDQSEDDDAADQSADRSAH